MYIIDVEVNSNSTSIVFDCILEYEFGFFIIPEGLNIIVLVYCLHSKILQEVGDS